METHPPIEMMPSATSVKPQKHNQEATAQAPPYHLKSLNETRARKMSGLIVTRYNHNEYQACGPTVVSEY